MSYFQTSPQQEPAVLQDPTALFHQVVTKAQAYLHSSREPQTPRRPTTPWWHAWLGGSVRLPRITFKLSGRLACIIQHGR
jgi:hypothetical protein